MTWHDVKLATLQKMYSSEGSVIPTDESTADFVAGMPFVCNEAMNLLLTAGKYLRKYHDIAVVDSDNETVVDVKAVISDFYRCGDDVEAYLMDNGVPYSINPRFVASRYLCIPARTAGTVRFFYDAYPPEITSITEDNYEFPLDREIVVLLPLYMASQLFKDEDADIATALRNEFEVAREALINPSVGDERSAFYSESGW